MAGPSSQETVCNSSGNGSEVRPCLVCPRPARGRSAYCSDAHRVQAFRLRHRQELSLQPHLLRSELRRRRQLAAHTVYECGACDERYLGIQRCPLFRRRNNGHYADLRFMPRWCSPRSRWRRQARHKSTAAQEVQQRVWSAVAARPG
jgi:hypothetical protein